MASDLPIENLFLNNLQSIGQELDFTWPGNAQVGRWNYRISVMAWPISICPQGSSEVFDYFLIELDGQASLETRGYRGPQGYELYMDFYQRKASTPTVMTPTGIVGVLPPGLELIKSSPDTTVATASYSDSISQTLGGSAGFFGESATASFNAAVTMSNSTTRTVSDLRIENRCGLHDNFSPDWQFLINPHSLEAEGATPLLAQFLIRRPHSSDPLVFSIWVYAFFSRLSVLPDPGLRGLPPNAWAGLDDYTFLFNAPDLPELLQHNARIGKGNPVSVAAPPPPPSA
jgi:hypothetical protein